MTGDDTIDQNSPASPSQVRDLAGEAMRRRIAARLFGEQVDAVFLGRFRIVEALGHGGMGVVYLAEDDQLDRRVAIKVIREDRIGDGPRERTRLLREARSLARLSHPNVVHVYEVGEHDGGVFIVMELVRGTTLREWLSAGPRSLAEVLARFIEAGQGLAAAHAAGIVHGDFKPANALVGEDGRVRIVDFGLARGHTQAAETAPEGTRAAHPRAGTTGVGLSLPSTATPAGTPGYMAPEQLLGAPSDARSDQYAFCVALFEAVYERPPVDQSRMFPGASAGALVPMDRRVPGWLRRVLARGLATRPDDRHASMMALIVALRETPRRRMMLRLTIAGTLVMATALALAIALGGALSKQPSRPLTCPARDQEIQALWGAQQRVAIAEVVARTGLPYARRTWDRIESSLEAYAARWIAAHAAACQAWVRTDRTSEEHDASVACLEDALIPLRELVAVLGAGDTAALAEADALVAGLPAPERCTDDAVKMSDRRDGRSLRGTLDRVKIALRTAQSGDAIALLGPLIEYLHAHGHSSLEAEALLLQGKVEGQLLRQPSRARRSLEAAQDRAGLAERTDLLWQILNEQAWVSASEFDAEEARRLWQRASMAAQSTDEPTTMAALASVESEVLLVERHPDAAVQRATEVVALFGEPGPNEHPDLLEKRVALAALLGDADRVVEALALNRALFTELTRRYGADHPVTARVELHLGFDYVDAGRDGEARPHVEHAREVLVASLGRYHPRVATADLALAYIAMGEGEFDAAIERARAADAVCGEILGMNSAARISALVLLAELFMATSRTSELLAVHLALLEIHKSGVRHSDIDVPVLLANIGDGLCALGRCPEALEYFGALLAIESGPRAEPLLRALAQRGMGLVHLAKAEPAAALLFLDQALALLQALPSTPDVTTNLAATARETADALTRLRRDPGRVRTLRALARRLDASLAEQAP